MNDVFRDIDDMTVEEIADRYPVLTEKEKDRMFAMSERKFNIKERKKEEDNVRQMVFAADGVEGVEEYDRPMWMRILTTAAALFLIGGSLAVGRNLLRRRPSPDNITPPNIATAVNTGTQTTTVTATGSGITYTIDVDGMLSGIETTYVTTAAAAPPIETAAPAVAATEPPTTAAEIQEDNEKEQEQKEETAEDSALIAKANEYYLLACEYYWKFRYLVGEIYELGTLPLDYGTEKKPGLRYNMPDDEDRFRNSMAYDEYGNYLGIPIEDPSVQSIDDILIRYGEVFDSRYDSNLREYFTEYNGKVYWRGGMRGTDQYYQGYMITDILKKEGDEITFNVEISFKDENNNIWFENDEFSVIVYSNNDWKVGKFRFPQ